MKKRWNSPIYLVKSHRGENLTIDVTSSISFSLPPHSTIKNDFIPYLKRRGQKLKKVLDFGGGALRHIFPLLDAGYEVCTVEFKETYSRPKSKEALAKAEKHKNFSKLIWPNEFYKDKRRFDAVLLCFVLQVVPIPAERREILKHLYKKLQKDGVLFYMSRYGQVNKKMKKNRVSDGYYMWPERKTHSFYVEFNSETTHKQMNEFKLKRLKSFSKRGTEQIYLYGKGKSTWP